MEPIRIERARWSSKMNDVRDIVEQGSKKAGAVAQATMEDVRSALKLAGPERAKV
jgi:hypothetical protein